MASFSFGAGNAAKIVRIPLYAAGRMLTVIVPRSARRWVIGCGIGIGDGALVMADHCREEGQDLLWLAASKDELAEAKYRGMRAVHKHSPRGLWETARAGVVIVTHGFGDVNRYAVSGAYIVQLWHGIPLKRVGLDSEETLQSTIFGGARFMRALLRFMYTNAARRIRLLPASSHLVRGRLQTAFALPDKAVVVTGEPRVDVLSAGSADERRAHARGVISQLTGADCTQTFILYAPTWRDGARDPAVPSEPEWDRIRAFLRQHNSVLLVRSHPLGKGHYLAGVQGDTKTSAPRVLMLGSDVARDITDLLPGIDVLVTDFSSLAYDSALVPLPVVFFAPDVVEYQRRRGFYGEYADVASAGWAETWSETLVQLGALFTDENERLRRIDAARALSARVHAYRDGGNASRVYRQIKKHMAMQGHSLNHINSVEEDS